MADKLKTSLAAAATSNLTSLTEHGTVRIVTNGLLKVSAELDDSGDGVWEQVAIIGPGPGMDVSYVGTKLNLTNIGTAAANVRVGQLA